jgi:hypothetical protein
MMRTFWFVAGTAAGVYASSRARRAAEALTLDGVHDRLTGWFAGATVLRDEVRAGMDDKESELRERLQLAPSGPRALTPGGRAPGADGTVAAVHRLHPEGPASS